jgi:hypothetical protein
MRRGMSPEEAGMALLRRIAEHSPQWFRNSRGEPTFNLWLYLLAPDGRYAGVTMRGPKHFSIADKNGARLESCVALFRD